MRAEKVLVFLVVGFLVGLWFLVGSFCGANDPDDVPLVVSARAPLDTDGATRGIKVGTLWVEQDSHSTWVCLDNTPNEAIWIITSLPRGAAGKILGANGSGSDSSWSYPHRQNLLTNTNFGFWSRANGVFKTRPFWANAVGAGVTVPKSGVSENMSSLVTGQMLTTCGALYTDNFQSTGVSLFEIEKIMYDSVSTGTSLQLHAKVSDYATTSGATEFCWASPGILKTQYGPDDWRKDTGVSIWRVCDSPGTIGVSSYSILATVAMATPFNVEAGGTPYQIWWEPMDKGTNKDFIALFNNKPLSAGVYVKSSYKTGVSIFYNKDGVWTDTGETNTLTDQWEWLSASYTPTAGTTLYPFGLSIRGGTTVYICQPILDYGSAIGEGNYSPGEPPYNLLAGVSLVGLDNGSKGSGASTINLERASLLRLPSDVKAVQVSLQARQALYGNEILWIQPETSGLTNVFLSSVTNTQIGTSGEVLCDKTGDFQLWSSKAWDQIKLLILGIR